MPFFADKNDQNEDDLTQHWFHKLLVFFHKPARWSTGRLVVTLILLAIVVALVWYLAMADWIFAVSAGAIYLVFSLVDALLFWTLPRFDLSYGSWKSQTVVLTTPRFAVSLALVPIAVFASTIWAVAGLTVLQGAGSLALIWGAFIEPFRLELTRVTIVNEKLPQACKPVRILHISDLHVERLTKRERKLVERVAQTDADLILITGDYLNLSYVRDQKSQAQVRTLLSNVAVSTPVYAVLGSPPVDERDVVPDLFTELPVVLLRDQGLVVRLNDDRQLWLLGMDCSHSLPSDSKRLSVLMEEAPEQLPSILMYHSPDLFPEAVRHSIDLYLCGHTHGGQVRLPWLGALVTSSQFGRRYQMGLYEEGLTRMFVSRGVGMEGLGAPRVRFLCRPEIALITLKGRA